MDTPARLEGRWNSGYAQPRTVSFVGIKSCRQYLLSETPAPTATPPPPHHQRSSAFARPCSALMVHVQLASFRPRERGLGSKTVHGQCAIQTSSCPYSFPAYNTLVCSAARIADSPLPLPEAEGRCSCLPGNAGSGQSKD